MCTAITMQSRQGGAYLGRTMDFSHPLDPELYFIPKGYEWQNILNTHKIRNQYRFMGIGQDISPIVFADGVNERGFSAAVLYFPGYAQYSPIVSQEESKPAIAAIELVGFLLGMCASVGQASSVLRTIRIVGTKDSVTNSVAPLHWILADQSGACMAVEATADGLHLMKNPIGVLSNSPDFQWHLTNLRNFMNINPFQFRQIDWSSVALEPFGQGGGTFGLPGDYTPPARFIKAAYQKSHTPLPEDRKEAIATCFHILEGVSIPKGSVMTGDGTPDYTQYTAFIDLPAKEYYFKTYDNSQITAVKLPETKGGDSKIVSLGKLQRPIVFEQWEF